MARKSRRNISIDIENKTLENHSSELNLFKTAVYVRLSTENTSSNTIENQITYCKKYVEENIELDLIDIYIDNGVSGTVFDRPEFNRLIADLNNGKINCIVCKDLSRFGRDYIETGIYLERILPRLNVRFIAINEKYDNFTTDKKNEALMIPLQNMINTLYAKDISRKICTTFRTSMKNGTFRQPSIPYGYVYDENNIITIDNEVADYIRMIFKWRIEGVSIYKIKDILDELNVNIPSVHKLLKKDNVKSQNIKRNNWNTATIRTILKNEFYTGDSVWGKSITALYKGEKRHNVKDIEDMFIFKNTHSPIISREDFELVKEIREKSSQIKNEKQLLTEPERQKVENLFMDKIFCGDCGKKMYLKRIKSYKKNDIGKNKLNCYYVCSTPIRNRAKSGGYECSSHRINRDELNFNVLSIIKIYSKTAVDYEKLIKLMKEKEKDKDLLKIHTDNIANLKLKLNGVYNRRKRLYDDFTNGILNEKEYIFAKEQFNIEYDNLNSLIEDSTKKQTEFNEALSSDNKWINLMKSVGKSRKLTKKLVDAVIEKILIYENKKFEITMKCDDVFKITEDIIKNIEGEKNNE